MRHILWLGCALSTLALAQPREFEVGMNAMLEGNFAEAYCHWKPLAEKGHAESQYNLGWLYANGNGMNVNEEQASRWWHAAAEQGHADAQFALGLGLITGVDGLKKNSREAVAWFTRAATQGHRDSREILSRLNADPEIDLLAMQPDLLQQDWYGSPGKVTGDMINVRAEPTTQSKVVTKLERGTPVKLLGQRGNWIQVMLPEGSEPRMAWIYHSLVTQTD